MEAIKSEITAQEAAIQQQPRMLTACDANIEMVDLLMERSYRERLSDAYMSAKKKLVCTNKYTRRGNWILRRRVPFAGQKTPCSAKEAVCLLQRCGLSLVSSAPKK